MGGTGEWAREHRINPCSVSMSLISVSNDQAYPISFCKSIDVSVVMERHQVVAWNVNTVTQG